MAQPAQLPAALTGNVIKKTKGRAYEDYTVGQVFHHHWGRTITEGDNSLFCSLTLHYNPLYFNAEYARAHGHPGIVVNPLLVFNTALGLSVEDLSEGGGAFLGVDGLKYGVPVYPGDTLTVNSTVLDIRESKSQPDRGIVSWRTQAHNQRGELVIEFKRANFKIKRNK